MPEYKTFLAFILILSFFYSNSLYAQQEDVNRLPDRPLEEKAGEKNSKASQDGICEIKSGNIWGIPERGAYGPLDLWSQSPFQSLRLGMIPRSPTTLTRTRFALLYSGTWANTWAFEEFDYLLDYDRSQTTISVSYSATSTLQMEVGFEDIRLFGAVSLDKFIEKFHSVFGITQDHRDEYPVGGLTHDIMGNVLQLVSVKDIQEVSGQSLHFMLQKDLTECGSNLPLFSISFTGRIHFTKPKGTPSFGYGDAGVCLSMATKRYGMFIYFSLSYSRLGLKEIGLLKLNKHQLASLLALEFPITGNFSLIVQYLATQGVAKDLFPFDQPSNELTFGFKWELQVNTIFEFGLIENIFIYDNSPDFGIHAGVKWYF